VPVGPNDKKGQLADTQCSAAVGVIHAYGPGSPELPAITRSSDGAHKPVHSRECFCGNPGSTNEQGSVAAPVGQFMEHARCAIGKMDLNYVREALTRR
jgi:hypothetical protein